MSQVPETHETNPAPLLDVEMLISNMHAELLAEARHAASIALRLRDSGQPWNQLIPLMLCVLPELADALGPVQVPPMPEFHQRPRWSAPEGASLEWHDTLATLEVISLLLPDQLRGALKHRRQSGPPARVTWHPGVCHPGLAALL